jgi:hypothetical protein
MTNEEANKVIAEYINSDGDFVFNMKKCYRHDGALYYPFCESLDALVPVWERLRIGFNVDLIKTVDNYYCSVNNGEYYKDDAKDTIQEAAAHATALFIKELK